MSPRLPWLILALVLVSAIACLHITAIGNFWYWHFPWLDVPMHFLAGAFMAAAVIGVLGKFHPRFFFLSMFAGAVGWEIFELAVNVEREVNFVFDTSLDLLMDTLGITLIYGLARATIWRST